MLQISLIREHKQRVINGLQKKNFKNAEQIVEQVCAEDEKRRENQTELDNTLAESNRLAKEIGILMKEGKKDQAAEAKAKTASLKEKSKELSENLKESESRLQKLLYEMPNLPADRVPAGKTAEDNVVLLQDGEIPDFDDSFLPHWELIKKYDIVDFELGVKITGAGFPVYKGKGARLQRALINFFLDEATKAGYLEIQPPILVNEESCLATGQLPDKEGQMYFANEDKLYLIPTAEVPITNLYRDTILKVDQLPIKNVGYTPCFRREAGSWGAHVRGLNRLHQFDKVEIVQITQPEKSYETLEQMSAHIQGLLKKLELPYRVLLLCGGDISFNAALCYDMEVFSGAQKRWLEVSSASNFETFQANRLKLRFKDENGKSQLLHTLNGSALALPRIMAALLENNQTPEGIRIPKVLQAYTGFDLIS
ncbi:MAG: serine--tRNA ligase [Bacteroidetes bacterium]|nr:MAG: serine--tRNA ligase [Bacteroidota bacterium]